MAEETKTVECYGRLLRRFPVAVSAGALAGAWARQEDAPAGATVVVHHEISALGRHGAPWEPPPGASLCFAMVLRPPVAPEDVDVAWLVGGLGAVVGAEAVSGQELAVWWPDRVVAAGSQEVRASLKVESQLGPAQVRSAVVVMRFDLAALGLEPDRREELLEAVVTAVDAAAARLVDGPEAAAAAYEGRCILMERRVKVRLLPKGETRGTVSGFDRSGRLELRSGTGMVERIGVDQLRDLQLA